MKHVPGVLRFLRRMVSREASGWTVAVSLVAIVGCGGTTTTGTAHHVDVGRDRDASAGGSEGSATDASGAGGSHVGNFGGTGSGSGGTGGVACECFTGQCAPGTQSVPGSASFCNPSCHTCQPCGPTSCPFMPPCASGQHPITPPGQCCPSSCSTASDGGTTDAGTCPRRPPPSCQPNSFPACAPDWTTAESWYSSSCGSVFGTRLARCGPYDAVITSGIDSSSGYFYDNTGKLVGSEAYPSWCESYDSSFVPPPQGWNGCVFRVCPVDAGAHRDATP